MELKLNSSTKVDGKFRLAQLAQNPMLAAVFLCYYSITLDNRNSTVDV